jgi:hypothetical protein
VREICAASQPGILNGSQLSTTPARAGTTSSIFQPRAPGAGGAAGASRSASSRPERRERPVVLGHRLRKRVGALRLLSQQHVALAHDLGAQAEAAGERRVVREHRRGALDEARLLPGAVADGHGAQLVAMRAVSSRTAVRPWRAYVSA